MTVLALLWAGATTLAAPAIRLGLHERVRRGKEIAARLPERRGIDPTPRPPGRLMWLHAASVGETVSILPVLSTLAVRAPDLGLLLTTGTVTSARLLDGRLPALDLAGRVLHRFAPLDVPHWVRRFLDHWRPDVAAFVESELWPNLLAACGARRVPLVLVNARLSPRSAALWRQVPGLAREVLGQFARILAQSPADAARLAALGAPRVEAPGDLKFASPPLPADAVELDRLRAVLRQRPRWLAASTHPGEETLIAATHERLVASHPDLLTLIAPRHPERGAAIAATLAETTKIHVTRRALGEPPPSGGIWIADTLGELGLLYRLCDIVFVGRSLVAPGGGQNPLEPARLACAVAVGPHTSNFAAAAEALAAASALARVPDPAALAAWVDTMLRDPVRRADMASAAQLACNRYQDLPERTAETLLGMLPPA
jgi:3-deoxy-D-manno-octulosonic-acid transferase